MAECRRFAKPTFLTATSLGKVTATGHYPERVELAALFGLKAEVTPASEKSSCCCGGSC